MIPRVLGHLREWRVWLLQNCQLTSQLVHLELQSVQLFIE